MKWNQAIRLLEECEQGLRKLVAEAASEGDYASVLRIADLAKAVAVQAAEGRLTPAPSATPLADVAPAVGVSKVRNVNNSASGGVKPAVRLKPRPSADAYPKFFRRGDELVKVGWSKKDRKEYNHRAPREAVDAVGAAVRQTGAKGKLFKGDALLPVENPADGSVLPSYQVYVALAWFKHLGVIEQHGRRAGYTLPDEKQITSTIAASWPNLSEWRG